MSSNKKIKLYTIWSIGLILFVLLSRYLNKSTDYTLGNMTVVLTAKVLKDDVFQLFYWEASESEFKIVNSVRANIKGSENHQKIIFKLPKIENLFRLRLDIGENFDQEIVAIKEIEFIKKDRLVFGNKGFNRLFAPNRYVTALNDYSFRGNQDITNGKPIFDPYFISVDGSDEMEMIRTNNVTNYPYLISVFISMIFLVFALYNIDRIAISVKGIFGIAFIIILLLPTIQNEVQFTKPLESLEKRELAQRPEFSFTTKFARDFEMFYDDNFGLRNNLVDWGGSFRTKIFRASMHPDKVMFGKDKWLFYNRMDGRMYRSYSHTSLLSADQLNAITKQWEDNRVNYNTDGREYFISFWPNKHSIYDEYLPWNMKIQIKDSLSRVDQIIRHLKNVKSKVTLLDVRSVLIEDKSNRLLYHKFDSHWNDYGAFLAYQSFFEQNKSKLSMEPKKKSDFNITWSDYNQGELIQMLGVRNKGFFIEKNPRFELKEDKDQIEYLPTDGFPRLTVITKNEICGNKLRVLIYRDSFTNSLIQFFSLHFYEVHYIWGHQEEFVEKLKPDIIIDCFVEREIGERIR